MPFVCRECENPCFIFMPFESVEPSTCVISDTGQDGKPAYPAEVKWERVTVHEFVTEVQQWYDDMGISKKGK